MLATLASDTVMDAAFQWLCQQHRHWPADTDVWDLRFHWPDEKQRIQQTLLRGDYRFVALSRVIILSADSREAGLSLLSCAGGT
ncbi:MAG: hypothetical protein PVJ03_08495 [Chromatiaceae bacterium]|jgi:hypothetical protein